MTPYQVARQIRYLLRERAWEGAGSVVFLPSSVRVTPTVLDRWLATKPMPLCIIGIGAATHDAQTPQSIDQQYVCALATLVPGDEVGEDAVVGGARSGGSGNSGNRGLTEIEEEFWAVAQSIRRQSGIEMQAWANSAASVQQVEGVGMIASRQYTLRARCTTARTYLGVSGLSGVAPGGGAVVLSWKPAPLQWCTIETLGGQRLVYKSGGAPPISPTDGAAVSLIGTAASASVSPLAAGTWSFSVFSAYNETGMDTPQRYSDPVSITLEVS